MNNHARNPVDGDLAPDAAMFLHLVERLMATQPELTPVQAGILVAAREDIARDSRTFARLFGMAHAIVLRELNALVQSGDLLTVTKRDARTLRTHYLPTTGRASPDNPDLPPHSPAG
ncbi:hypothetical protein [Thalassospira povalilytica]|uniref:hypothetical protein n=1 Tax=Thalassospira povalilytica TaxID=732237 RepID=UPI001BB05822|nr:hypothetical protein [Thalassospira povalilytica]